MCLGLLGVSERDFQQGCHSPAPRGSAHVLAAHLALCSGWSPSAEFVGSCRSQACCAQTALATSTVLCSLLGLGCLSAAALSWGEGSARSTVSFIPHSWDHQRQGAWLCSLRKALTVAFLWFTNFNGDISWISGSSKLEGMNALAHFWRNVVSEIQTSAISSGR